MHHETVDPLKTEPGFGIRVPRRQRMVWTGSKTARNRGSYDDALLMRGGTGLQNGARDAIGARGTAGNAILGGFMAVCQK